MRLPQKLVAAINTYYAFKNGDGMFISGEAKKACLEEIDKQATFYCYGLVIVPGVIFLSRGKKVARINGPFLPGTSTVSFTEDHGYVPAH